MTPEERKVLEDAEQQAFDTASAFYDVPTSGIRPPPLIEETETTLEPQLFGFEFGQQPEAEAEPESSSTGGGISCSDTTLFIRFSGIVFDCGCTTFDDTNTNSFIVTDEGNVNSFVVETHLDFYSTPHCGDCAGKFWEPLFDTAHLPHYVIDFWNFDTGCPPPPDGITNEYLGVALLLLSGTWYLVAWNSGLVFYGSAANLSSPITNTLSCDTTFHDLSSDPALNCIFSGSPYFNYIAHGGTATVALT